MIANVLNPSSAQRLLDFIGYGPEDPKYVFIGCEEASEGHLANLEIRLASFPLLRHDKNAACAELAAGYAARKLASEATRYARAVDPGEVPPWTFAAKVAVALRDPARCEQDGPWHCKWQDEYRSLGSSDGDSFLAEAFPLPKPGLKDWPAEYASLFGYAKASAYYTGLWPRRRGAQSTRRDHLRRHVLARLGSENVVICYGGSHRVRFRRLFDLRATRPSGLTDVWHALPGGIDVGMTTRGTRVAICGFPYNSRAGGRPDDRDIPTIVNGLRDLTD